MVASDSPHAQAKVDPVEELCGCLEEQRKRLFDVCSILDCCRYATATMLRVDDPEFMGEALRVSRELANGVAGELEHIIDALPALARKTQRRKPGPDRTRRR